MGKVEPCKLDLPRAGVESAIFDNPVVQGTVILKFKTATTVRDTLDRVFQRMREVVHRINHPLCALSVVRRFHDTVNDGIAHIDIVRRHVDFRAENLFAVVVFSRAHFPEKSQVFFHASVAVRAVYAGLGKRAAGFADFFRGQIADVRKPFFDKPFRKRIHFFKVIGRIIKRVPFKTQPLYVFLNAVDVFDVFFRRVGVVETQIASAVIFFLNAEIYADGFCVADMQIPVRFGRETRRYERMLAAFKVGVNDVFNKVGWFCKFFHICSLMEKSTLYTPILFG